MKVRQSAEKCVKARHAFGIQDGARRYMNLFERGFLFLVEKFSWQNEME